MPVVSGRGLWSSFRRSRGLVVTIVFIAMMLDLITLTTLEPILPDIVLRINNPELYSVNSTMTQQNASVLSLYMDAKSGVTRDVGLILATKPGTEIFANLVVGHVVDRYGHKYPMVFGCLANFLATTGFAFGRSVSFLIGVRIVQAIGSSLSIVSGLSLLASVFRKDDERSTVNAIAFAGLSVGMIVGFPFGTACYQFMGKEAPFLIIASLMAFDGVLRFILHIPSGDSEVPEEKRLTFIHLLLDPYIAVALGFNIVQHVALGVVIATEAAWMLDSLHAQPWQIGLVLVIGALAQCFAQIMTGQFSVRFGRWSFCGISLLVSGVGIAMYPFCFHIWQSIGPEVVQRLGLGITLAVIAPLLGYIVDVRHDSNYGAIFGLYAASYNFGLVIGPLAGGLLVEKLTFNWLYRGTAVCLIAYSTLCVVFRDIKKTDTLKIHIPAEKYGTFENNNKENPTQKTIAESNRLSRSLELSHHSSGAC